MNSEQAWAVVGDQVWSVIWHLLPLVFIVVGQKWVRDDKTDDMLGGAGVFMWFIGICWAVGLIGVGAGWWT